jgi:hypothetical protein
MNKAEENKDLWVDQLYSEQRFLEFCNSDPSGTSIHKFERRIDSKFLEACEKDKFILPLFSETVTRKDQNGNETQTLVKFYSPFQIFFVTALSKNQILDDGLLRDLEISDLEYQKQHNTRYINWCGTASFNISENDMRDTGHPNMYNHFTLAKDFHNFLKFLHSNKVYDETSERDYEKVRGKYDLPKLQYKFPKQKDLTDALKKHDLNVSILEKMMRHIGYVALNIDPNKEWYNYIQKHSQRKRDEFRGLASVAQELYNFCNILTEVIEISENKKLTPFIEFVYADFSFVNDKQINTLARGDDILAIQKTAQDLISWLKNNEKYLHDFYANNPEIKSQPFLENANTLDKIISEFHKKYGDIRYVGNYRKVVPSKFKYADLEPLVRRHIDMVTVVEGNNKSRKFTPEEKEEHVENAINSTVGDFRRSVIDYCSKVRDMLYTEKYRQENLKNMSMAEISKEYFSQDRNGVEEGVFTNKFYREYLPAKQKVFDDAIKIVEDKQNELSGIINKTWLVFCAKCRKNYVVMHEQNNDYRASSEAICDTCISKEDLQKLSNGEWRCEFTTADGKDCNNVLQKFAHGNLLNSNLFGGNNLNLNLNYGNMEIQIKCSKCKYISKRTVDWGWLP